jgi:hypothetical protein
MFKDTKEGTTHYENDNCGEPAHNQISYAEHKHRMEKCNCEESKLKKGKMLIGKATVHTNLIGSEDSFVGNVYGEPAEVKECNCNERAEKSTGIGSSHWSGIHYEDCPEQAKERIEEKRKRGLAKNYKVMV